jgi:hypothetical protein
LSNEETLNFFNLLEDMHKRLSKLEQMITETRPQPIHSNIRYPSHGLSTSTKTMTDTGLISETSIPVCSNCHHVVGDDFYVCHHCNCILCTSPACALIYLNKAHCEKCFRENHLDISKRDYLVLSCLINGFKDTNQISDLTLISFQEVELSISSLLSSNLISLEPRFFGLFHELRLTDSGMIAATIFRQIYGTGEDVAIFGRTIRNRLAEERGVDVVIPT